MRARPAITSVTLSTALAAILLRGLWPGGDSVVIGPPGDNLGFVWNTWWAAGNWHAPSFHTSLLFAPWGTSLLLNTHTLLPSTVAAAWPGVHVLGGTNVVVALHLALNALCAFALACRVTRRLVASAVAAIVFAWSPFVGAHLAGHFNLIAAWVLPLSALLFLRTLEDDGLAARIGTGITFGAIAYVDYYLLIYAGGLALVILTHRCCRLQWQPSGRRSWSRATIALGAVLLGVDLVVLAAILATGGGRFSLAGRAVSFRGPENPAAAAGLLAMLIAAAALLPRLRIDIDRAQLRRDTTRLAVPIAVAALLIAPLATAAMSLWRSGGYVTQAYFWRSAPAGVDLATLVLGNPSGALWMNAPAAVYARLHIDVVERVAWLGPGVIALAGAAIRLRRGDRQVTLWTAVALVFGIWALGPRLQAFGRDLHVFLPAVLLRYAPLAANARMPGRATVVVYLAVAVLAAMGFDALVARGRRTLAWTLALLVLLDFLPAAPQFYRPDHPAVYDALAQQDGPGTVCELPMGLRDGFGETGRLDMRTLYYQTIHGRPMTGGFVARLDPRLLRAYEREPVLGVLLRLSGGAPLAAQQLPPPQAAAAALTAQGIRFVMLNRRTAPPDLVRYVESGLPLRALARDGERTLYTVEAPLTAAGSPTR